MCYDKGYLTKRIEKYAKRYAESSEEINFIIDQLGHLNVGPTYHASGFDHPLVPVLIDTTKKIELYSWGLIPYWTKSALDAVKLATLPLMPGLKPCLKNPPFGSPPETAGAWLLPMVFLSIITKQEKLFRITLN